MNISWQPIVEAKATAVWLDKNYRPVRIPSELKSKLVQFLRKEDSWINSAAKKNIWECSFLINKMDR